jgi:hypothetical protein
MFLGIYSYLQKLKTGQKEINMKFINALINEVRESSENEEFDSILGLTEEEILKFINQAQNRLHSKIVGLHKQVFSEEKEVQATSNTESYNLFYNSYLKNYIHSIEYTSTGNANDYYPLRPTSPHNRYTGADGGPDYYFIRAGKFYVLPTPTDNNGKYRVTHVRRPKNLDKRRGTIFASGYDSTTAPTYIDITYVNGQIVDKTHLDKKPYITVVDKFGNQKLANILVDSIQNGAGSVGSDARINISSSAAIDLISALEDGDYVISGDYSTTHLEWSPEVERYMQIFAEYKVLKRDSSIDSTEMFQELAEIESDILDSYAELSDDIIEIADINNSEDWGF